MSLPRNSDLLIHARRLRKEMTKEERLLWYGYLRECPVKFYRQRILGNYIADFYSAKAKLVIELDGSQHGADAAKENDATRDAWLKQQGITVLRYSNRDIQENFEGVCGDVLRHLSR